MKKHGATFNLIRAAKYWHANNTSIADYVRLLYPMKSTSTNPVTTSLIKLLLNSLYGKFGQNRFDDLSVYSIPYYNMLEFGNS